MPATWSRRARSRTSLRAVARSQTKCVTSLPRCQQIEEQVRLNNEMERQKKIAEENRTFAVDMTTSLTDGIKAAVQEGEKFGDTLRKISIKMIEIVVQTSLLAPLAKNIGNSFANLMGGKSIGNVFGLQDSPLGVFGGNSLSGDVGSWLTSVVPFANGGVFDSPVALAAGRA